ncbi:MAG: FkbM family methyltransferase [Ignavibacteriaceae bacterium]
MMSNSSISFIEQLIKTGEYEKAETASLELLDENENDADAFSKLGEIYLLQGKEIEAEIFFEKAKKIQKNKYISFGQDKECNHILETFLQKNDLIFDVGANIGKLTEKYLDLGAKVICVEPQSSCIKILSEKFNSNPMVKIIKKGVSNRIEILDLFVCNQYNEIATFSSEFINNSRHANNFVWDSTEKIETTTLDELINLYGIPKFCKIDVEGFELKVLKGLTYLIPYLSFEFHIELIEQTFIALEYLKNLGYEKFSLTLGPTNVPVFDEWASLEKLIEYLKYSKHDWLIWGDIYACSNNNTTLDTVNKMGESHDLQIEDEPLIAGYCIVRNAEYLSYPFYDAVYQCMPNVDSFHIFYDIGSDDNTVDLTKKFVDELSKYFRIEMHPIKINWNNQSAISEAQNVGARFLKGIGYKFVLLNQADEFLPVNIKEDLRRHYKQSNQIGFEVIHTWKDEYEITRANYCRFYRSDFEFQGDGANVIGTEVLDYVMHKKPIHHLGTLFVPDRKYDSHSKLYGSKNQAFIAANINDIEKVEKGFSDLIGIKKFKPLTIHLREREKIVVSYSKKYETYPFELALNKIVDECELKIKEKSKIIKEKGNGSIINIRPINKGEEHFLSFIIPCYNSVTTINEAIDSIYIQNLNIPFEVLCVDDGSVDHTYEILKEYEQKYSNMRILRHEQNLGGAAARNTLVNYSSGDLIFCLDSDNVLAPSSINKLIKCLDDSDCEAASFAELRYFSNSIDNSSHSWIFEAPNNVCDLKHIITNIKTPAASGNYLYTRKSYIKAGGYPLMSGAMDAWGFGFRQHASGAKIAILSNSFYFHRISENGYWMRENRAHNNDKNATKIVREYSYLFDKETQKWLRSAEAEENFFENISKGKLKINNDFGIKSINNIKVNDYNNYSLIRDFIEKNLWNGKQPLNLHLGCGEMYFNGYVNIDYPSSEHTVQQISKADYFADITEIDFPNSSVDEIRLHHVFEHFDRAIALALLCKWNMWLKVEGKLVIETPDLEGCISLLVDKSLSYQQKQSVLRHIFGSHEAKWAYHYDGWYEEKYKVVLNKLGFEITNIELNKYELTRNIIVTAQKRARPLYDEIVENGKQLLRDSMVNKSETEERLWKTWCGIFERKMALKNNAASSSIYQKKLNQVVSVFMPVFNGEKYLSETLDSLLSQTFSNFELIIVDDGSTDKTWNIAHDYSKKDERIKVFSIEHRGEVYARNFALTKISSSSEYLMNHDSDDISMPQKLEKLVAYLESNPEVDIVGSAAVYFDDQGQKLGQPPIEYDFHLIKQSFGRKNSIINSAALIRKRVYNKIGNYKEEFRSVDDYDFFSRALIAGFRLVNLKEILHKIRLHSNSIGSKRAETQKILADKISKYYEWSLNKKNNKNINLHLGCGDVKIEKFINVDIDPYLSAVDIVDNAKELRNFDNNTASLIYACHVLEHFPNNEIKSILSRWFEVLEYGGELRISVPDIDRIVNIYNKNIKHFLTPGNTPWIGLLYGGQTDIYDYHKTGFNFTYLKTLLEEVGFSNVKEYPHSPHWLGIPFDASMAKEPFNEYISLNIMAIKPQRISKNNVRHYNYKQLDILHTVEFYNPHVGGAEIVMQELSERLVKRGHSVSVATTKIEERNIKKLNGVNIVEFDIKGSLSNGVVGGDIAKYQNFIAYNPADIMMNYAAQQWATDITFSVIGKIYNKRVNIVAPCGYSALKDSKTLRWPNFKQYFNEFIPKVIPLYDAAIYHSTNYQDYQFANDHKFTNSVIIPNGVAEEEFESNSNINFRQKYKIKNKFMGLCVANYYKDKGHERIIRSLKEISRTDLTIVFIGNDGKELNYLKKISENLDVIFLQDISREDTVAAFHQADIFLFGSQIEAFPIVILEAKASKTPFVSTNCGNVKDLKGGIVCDENTLASSINYVLDNETIRKNLGLEGYSEWKEKFTWESVVDRYEELYLRLYHDKFVNEVKSRVDIIQSQLQQNYNDVNSYIQAARLLINNNQSIEARNYLEDALELDYKNNEAKNLFYSITE